MGFFFCLVANAPHLPRVGVSSDRCISFMSVMSLVKIYLQDHFNLSGLDQEHDRHKAIHMSLSYLSLLYT